MKRSAVLLGLILAGCSAEPLQSQSPKEPLMLPQAKAIQAVENIAPAHSQKAPAKCPDGRPILSGWASLAHTADPNDHTSYIPGDADMKQLYAGRDANGRIIRKLANQIRARNQIIVSILSAARSGNWCGGPK